MLTVQVARIYAIPRNETKRNETNLLWSLHGFVFGLQVLHRGSQLDQLAGVLLTASILQNGDRSSLIRCNCFTSDQGGAPNEVRTAHTRAIETMRLG